MKFGRFDRINSLSWLSAGAILGAILLVLIGLDYVGSALDYRIPADLPWSEFVRAIDAGDITAIDVHGDTATVHFEDRSRRLVAGPFQNLEPLALAGIAIRYGVLSPTIELATGYAIAALLFTIAGMLYLRLARPLMARIRTIEKDKAARAARKPASPTKIRRAAIHEAGHALSAHAHGFEIVSAMVDPFLATGVVEYRSPEVDTRVNFDGVVCTLLAGHAAEVVLTGSPASGGKSDLQQATNLVRTIVRDHGMGNQTEGLLVDSDSPETMIEMAHEDELNLLMDARQRARDLIEAHQPAIQELADLLVAGPHELSGAETHALLAKHLAYGSATQAPSALAA